jgi:hypothetical protein
MLKISKGTFSDKGQRKCINSNFLVNHVLMSSVVDFIITGVNNFDPGALFSPIDRKLSSRVQ